jgi:hypothetical protein
VKIELLGQIELYFDRGSFYDFTSLGELQHLLQLQKHLDCGTGNVRSVSLKCSHF